LATAGRFWAPAAVAALRRFAGALRGGRRGPTPPRVAFLLSQRASVLNSVRAPVFDTVKYQNRRHDV